MALNSVYTGYGGDPFRDGKTILFMVVATLVGSFWIGRSTDWCLGAAHAVFTLSWAYSGARVFGLLPVLGPIALLACAQICASNEKLFLLLLRVTTWAQLGLAAYQRFGGRTFGGNNPAYDYTMQGSFGNQVVVGAFFAMMVPLAFRFWSAREGLLITLFCLFSGSTMAVLALLGAFLYYLWRLRGRDAIYLGLIALGACILGAVLFPQVEFFSISGRQVPFRRAWELILLNPWGYSPGSWLAGYQNWQVPYPRIWSPMHSDPLQLLFEGGWPTFLLAAIGCFRVLSRVSLVYGCALAAVLVNSLGGFPFHLSALAFLAVTFLVMGQNARRINGNH